MILSDESTWPAELLTALECRRDIFLDKELRMTKAGPAERWNASRWDAAVYELCDVIKPFTIRGYHCARLTEQEIGTILSEGLSLPDLAMLKARITKLRKSGAITQRIARRLIAENQGAEANRARRIWFCFFPPRFASQYGIERFFRSWGGEALYNDHERDPATGPVLGKIGTPCLVEADVPMAGIDLRISLVIHTARQFLLNRGLKTREPAEHEDFVISPIPRDNIIRVIRFPDADFLKLTDCHEWDPPLD